MTALRSRSRSLLALAVAATVLVVAGSAFAQATAPDVSGIEITGEYGIGLAPNIAKHAYAGKVDQLINFLHVFMIALFVGWGAFFAFCLVKFRQRPGARANPSEIKAKPSKWLEIGVAVVEAVLLIGISMPAWASFKQDLPPEDRDPLHVRVYGEQFAWTFHYAGADGVFGKISPDRVDLATNPLGRDMSDPNGQDDAVSSEFHIPVDRPIIAEISSKDVIHSFFIPVLRVKQDAIPGMRISVWFEAGELGNYEIACAQLCGNNHYSMKAIMRVESASAFEAWLAEKSKGPEEFDEDDL